MIRTKHQPLSTTTPSLLNMGDRTPTTKTLVVQNINDSGYIYLGSESVTSTDYGFKLFPGQGFTIEMSAFSKLYAIASAAGIKAAVMEIERAI